MVDNVRDGAFYVANKLYGITFKPFKDVSVYEKDVQVFEVLDADGSYIGVLYLDYFPRPGKRNGAWMSSFQKQSIKNGEFIHPIIYNVGNFAMPTEDKPSLLTLEQVTTLFHEFGHGLHGLLSNVNYNGLSGTAVSRDFVELPSQIFEHWALHPDVLKVYAKHYQTGETIPESLVKKMEEENNNRAEREYEDSIIKAVVENAKIDVPEVMVEKEIDTMVRNLEQRLQYQGLNLEQYFQFTGTDEAKMREYMKENAEVKVKTDLVLEAVEKAENIDATEEELKEKAKEVAKMYSAEEDDKMVDLLMNGQRAALLADVKVSKTIKFLVENNK